MRQKHINLILFAHLGLTLFVIMAALLNLIDLKVEYPGAKPLTVQVRR